MDSLQSTNHVDNYDAVEYGPETDHDISCYDGDAMNPVTYKGFSGPMFPDSDEALTYLELESRIAEILPERTFRIFMMRANNCEYEEIAQEIGVTVGNARTIFRRAKELLQEKLTAA